MFQQLLKNGVNANIYWKARSLTLSRTSCLGKKIDDIIYIWIEILSQKKGLDYIYSKEAK